MAKITFKVKGFEEVMVNLRAAGDKFDDAVAWPATIAAAEFVRDEAISNAILYVDDLTTRPYIPDNIKIAKRVAQSKKTGKITVDVGVVKGRPKENHTWYWWWLELGSRNHVPKAFLRKAVYENLSRIYSTFYSVAQYELIKLGNYPHIRVSKPVEENEGE